MMLPKLTPLLLVATMFSSNAVAQMPATKSLRDAGAPILMGTAIMSGELDNPQHANLIGSQFSVITGGNEFKPDSVQPRPGVFRFDRPDKIIAFAEAHKIKVVGHTLLWHSQTPKFLFEDAAGKPLSREEGLANLKNHIDTVMKHFKGKVIGWDVVNEAISDKGDEYLRPTPAYKCIGPDYLEKAFEFAAAADPDAELYYNDYNIEQKYKRDKALKLVKSLRDKGLKVSAVGIQGHFLIDSPSAQEIDDGMQLYIDAGFKVMITELDVDVLPRKSAGADVNAKEVAADPFKAGLPEEQQERLAKRYAEIFAVFNKHKDSLTRITFWGSHDASSWLNDWPVRGRTNYPMLWDRNFEPKPAFYSVIKELEKGR